jgi:hypothetical protein
VKNEHSRTLAQPNKRSRIQAPPTETQGVANDGALVDNRVRWDGLPNLALSVLGRVSNPKQGSYENVYHTPRAPGKAVAD